MKKKPTALVAFCLALLAACGGSGDSGGSGSSSGGSNPPPPLTGQIEFRNLPGNTPADLGLGQPRTYEWLMPSGFTARSVALEATLTAGPTSDSRTCTVSAGTIPAGALSTTWTIPDVCEGRTVKSVQLRLAAENAAGQRTSAARTFTVPATPANFLPARLDLPVLKISTDNLAPIVSKDDYINAQMTLESNVPGEAAVVAGLQIRGRGNSTWGMPKKPYRLKLTVKQSLLGMPSSRDWVLLANYSDKTLMRNSLALELGAAIGMAWTPRWRSVEVYLNDRYDGVYLLAENIKVAADRVDIDELGEDDVGPDVITGGYLLEVDFREDGYTIHTAIDQLPIVFQDPDEPAPAQEAYIQGYLDEFESVLHSGAFADPIDGYAKYIDVDSFVRWYLVNELFRNVDSNMWTSCWMYKPRGGKLHMGPLWDFDLAAGNADYADAFRTTGWHVRNAKWFSRLFQDAAFRARVRSVWNEIMAHEIPAMLAAIRSRAATLQQGQLNNFHRWPILEMYVWPNNRVPGSYAGEIDYLDSWLRERIAWMDAQFNP